MIELDEALAELQGKAHDYRSSGLRSAQKIAENLQATAISAVLPLGMLDRAITGYRVTGLDDREKNAALAAQTIAGDPHTFTAGLGGIVSLILAGTERPVMGLSATAYFPQAVREHLHAPVRWWMTDAQANSIRATEAPHRLRRGPPAVRRAHQGLRHPPQPQEGRAHRTRRQPVRPVHPPRARTRRRQGPRPGARPGRRQLLRAVRVARPRHRPRRALRRRAVPGRPGRGPAQRGPRAATGEHRQAPDRRGVRGLPEATGRSWWSPCP